MRLRLEYLLIFIFSSVLVFADNEPLNLQSAVKKKLIDCKFSGSSASPHYYKPLIAKFQNLTSDLVKLKIPNGQIFISSDSTYQNLIVTKSELLVLKAKESLNVEIFSMCMERRDKAPVDNVFYTLGEMADAPLNKISLMIEDKKLFNYLGQQALWCFIDKSDLEEIGGFDEKILTDVLKFLAKEMGRPVPAPPVFDDYRRNYKSQKLHSTIKGTFKYTIAKKRHVSIILIDKNGIVVRELYNNENEMPGDHVYDFQYDAKVYIDDFYVVKLIADGRVLTEKKIVIK